MENVKISDLTAFLEGIAPRSSQESYDNAGLITGNPAAEIQGVLVSLDCTEEIVEEAIQKDCNVIVSHHPIVFKGLKTLTGKNYVERTVIKALKNDIALYAIHTNLDNAFSGVNAEISRRIGLENVRVLDPKKGVLAKLTVFVPAENLDKLNTALFEAGAGSIGNYSSCHFHTEGTGTFLPVDGANPYEGKVGTLSTVSEVRAEYLVSTHLLSNVLKAMRQNHPYEEIAYDVYPLLNENQQEGAGMIGELPVEMDETAFLGKLKSTFECGCIRHTALTGKKIKKVALCGGAGSFLLAKAKAAGADIFITGDFKYHEFFDAEGQILIADIGHYESEQFTSHLIADELKKKFTTFAVHLTGINTNPINYF